MSGRNPARERDRERVAGTGERVDGQIVVALTRDELSEVVRALRASDLIRQQFGREREPTRSVYERLRAILDGVES